MEKKRLIIFTPSIEGGGVEKNFFIISNFLSKKVNSISVITISNKIKKQLNNKINLITPKNEFWNNIGRRKKFIICSILLFLELIKNKNAVVLCFQGNVYCALICKLFSVKFILRSNTAPSGWSKNKIKIFLYKFIYGLADKIVVNSHEFKKEFNRKFGLSSVCIYNPLNKREIIYLSKKKISFNFFKKKNLNIVSVARLSDQKDHLTLLKAVNNLKNNINIKLLLIGSGDQLKFISDYINKKKLSKMIKIIKFKKNPYPFLLKSDLFVLSSKYEGLPNVLLEALVLKKFVISSNCPTGPKEVLDNGKGGFLFKTGEMNDLKNKILFFYQNRKKCRKLTLFGNKRLNRFDSKLNLNKYYQIIKNYIN